MSEITFRAGVAALAAAALGLRLFHAQAMLAPPFGDVLVQDARVYWESAQRLLGILPPVADAGGPSFMNVGYPWLLAALSALFGASVRAVLLAQAVQGAAACALVALAARGFTGRESAGLLAGLGAVLYAPALFYDGLLLTPAPTFACAALALWALAKVFQSVLSGRNF